MTGRDRAIHVPRAQPGLARTLRLALVPLAVALMGCSPVTTPTPAPSRFATPTPTASETLGPLPTIAIATAAPAGTPTRGRSAWMPPPPTVTWSTPLTDEAAAQALLARHGLGGKTAVQVVDALEASDAPRPLPLKVVVRPTRIELSDGAQTAKMALPGDSFYLAIAPFKQGNPECTYHNVSADLGELRGTKVHVVINNAANTPLVDADVTTHANGYAGFWLPRDQAGFITVTMDGLTGQTDYGTHPDSDTCQSQIHLK